MDNEGKTMAELAHEMLFMWAQRQGSHICQWCSRLVPLGHAYCDACYDMIVKHMQADGHDSSKARVVPVAAFLAILMNLSTALPATAGTATQGEDVEVADAAVNPFRHFGKTVRWQGVVEEIIFAGIPVRVLIKTSGYHWLASFYNANAPQGLLRPGNTIGITGTLISFEEIMVAGTQKKVLNVMATVVHQSPPAIPSGLNHIIPAPDLSRAHAIVLAWIEQEVP